MRFVRFRDDAGDVRTGEWTGEDGAEIRPHPGSGGRLDLDPEPLAADAVDVLPPCDPSKVVCVGLN